MIILRVAMGRGLLKETVKEVKTTLVFAKTATVDENCRQARIAICEIEGSTCGPGTPAVSAGTSDDAHMNTVDNIC
jgi:hypothetical protein